jgi:hypothetical protein
MCVCGVGGGYNALATWEITHGKDCVRRRSVGVWRRCGGHVYRPSIGRGENVRGCAVPKTVHNATDVAGIHGAAGCLRVPHHGMDEAAA